MYLWFHRFVLWKLLTYRRSVPFTMNPDGASIGLLFAFIYMFTKHWFHFGWALMRTFFAHRGPSVWGAADAGLDGGHGRRCRCSSSASRQCGTVGVCMPRPPGPCPDPSRWLIHRIPPLNTHKSPNQCVKFLLLLLLLFFFFKKKHLDLHLIGTRLYPISTIFV